MPAPSILRRRFLAASAAVFAMGRWSGLARSADPEAIEGALEEIRKAHDVPALAAAVVRDERPVLAATVGLRKIGDATAVTRDDQFHLGSCTKSMTATLAAILVEEGKLRWDTTLAKGLPGLAGRMHRGVRDVTLEMLLAHRGGLASNDGSGDFDLIGAVTKEAGGKPAHEARRLYVARALAEEPAAKPRTQFLYSNRGYIVAGALLEAAAGAPWERLIRKRLFDRLGMATAGFGAMGVEGKVEQPWQHRVDGDKREAIGPGPGSDNAPLLGPAGTVHASVGDWAKYVGEHLRGARGESKLLKRETFRRLHEPKPNEEYSGGWFVVDRSWGGGKVLMHSGSNTMSFAVAWLAPARRFAVLAAANQGGVDADKACDDAASRMLKRFFA